jgi:hypothetical protein
MLRASISSAMTPTESSIGTAGSRRGAIDVDVVCAQAAEGVGEECLDRGRPGIDAKDLPVGSVRNVELDADRAFVTIAALERLCEEELVVATGVEVASVKQREAGVERGVDRGDTLSASSAGP